MSAPKPLPPLEVLDHFFEVRDGKLLNRVPRGHVHKGQPAGTLGSNGYLFVSLNRQKFKVHRIIWAMTHRQEPGDLVIDHIDRNKLNNDPSNLRAIPKRLNALNASTWGHNTSGITGVSWHSRDARWIAQANQGGKHVSLGYFKDKQDAVEARLAWEQKQWEVTA